VFDFIVRRFLACCSDAAKGQSTVIEMEIAEETFTANGLTAFTIGLVVLERNYLDIYPFEFWSGVQVPNFVQGERVIQPGLLFLTKVITMNQSKTSKPGMLSEADLITKMDNSGIGTDATIHGTPHLIIRTYQENS
jgi:DNA topoisomerase III